MKKIFVLGGIALAFSFVSCKKEKPGIAPVTPPPETVVIDLGNQEMRYGNGPLLLDFNKDGTRDFLFNVSLVADPVAGLDKRRFMTSSGVQSKFAVNNSEEVPCMNKGDLIGIEDFDGYKWNLVLSVRLVERSENMAGDISWYGNWKYAVQKYLPFQMIINNKPHCGWVELSIDVDQQKIILHKAAYTKQPEVAVRAGM